MAIVQVPANGALPGGAVVNATETALDLSTAISGATPANKVINAFPNGGVGRLRFRVGAGAGTQDMTITAGDTPGFVRPVVIPVAGAGDYFWPTTRKALALALKIIRTATALGGTITPALMTTKATLANFATAGVLGITQAPIADGVKGTIITDGPAIATCSGGWLTGDVLVSAAGGALRKAGGSDAGTDRVAYAVDDRADGETACPVTVSLGTV